MVRSWRWAQLRALAPWIALTATGLARGLSLREGLRGLWGTGFTVWLAAAALSSALLLAELARALRRRRPEDGAEPEPRGRLAFAAVVLALVAHLVWLGRSEPLYLHLSAAAVAGLYPALLVAWRAAGRAGATRARRVGELVLLQLCLTLVLGELGLRALALVRPTQLLSPTWRGAEGLLAGNRGIPGELRYGFPNNSRGHYDEEFPAPGAGTLVATIGDSFSQSLVPHHHHYTTVCERALPGVTVANLGAPAIGPPEYLLLMDEALALSPDLVVVALFLGNDVGFDGRDSRPIPWWRTPFDRDHVVLANLPVRLVRIWREARALEAVPRAPAVEDRLEPEELEQHMPWLADWRLETPAMSVEAFRAVELARAAEICGSDEAFFEPLFAALERIVRRAGRTPVAFLLIPDELQVEDELWEDVVAGLPDRSLERARAQRFVGAWLARRSLPYEDLLPRLLELPELEDGKRHAYLPRNTHFNVLGNRVAGEGLADLVARVLGPGVR